MAGGISKLHRLYCKRSNLFSIASLAVLCSLFYFVGIWQHSGTSGSASLLAGIPCSPPIREFSAVSTLDFATHHAAGDADVAQTAVVRNFSACHVRYSEYTPCEDKDRSLKYSRGRMVFRERHCPEEGEKLKCQIPAPYGYRSPFRWPEGRDVAWFANVPHKELAVEKGGQNWVRFAGDRFLFPGGGTTFRNGAKAYIEDMERLIPLSDGSIRTAIDTGCGVASWGAYLLSRNIIAMSIAPRDTHEAQVQFALERGVPAMIGILASKRLPYPSRAFDMAHCSRCLVPWHQNDGLFLIEIDRILRPGGYWILSGPPVNWKAHWKGWERTEKDLNAEQSAIEVVAKSLCWKKLKEKGDLAIWRKPTNHIHCKMNRRVFKKPQFCTAQDPDAAWYTEMETCITPLPEVAEIREIAGGELEKWPERLTAVPPRIKSGTIEGITTEIYAEDTELWKRRVEYYKNTVDQLGKRGRYRNLLDMNSYLGGFAAALVNDPVWVMNVVPTASKINTLGAIYERGLIGTYQDWCEAMSTYPRTYDLLHAGSVFSLYKDRCEIEDILLEMDRILRPEGTVIFRDDVDVLVKIKSITDGMKWDSRIIDHEGGPLNREKLLLAVKLYWTVPKRRQSDRSSR